jgi:pimeloyl-ACP methyl ester carboxylesterase
MTTFVLVHGAWRGGWIWKRVRVPLERAGHRVLTPTLTGCADRVHLATRDVNLETHIADVQNLIRWEELDDVVLCGHSYAGCVVTGVADRMPERIRALVYLDAFVLENGQSLHDTVGPEQRAAQIEAARVHGEGWKVPPIPSAVFNANEADRAWIDAQATPQSLETFRQRLELHGGIDRVRTVAYVLATDFPHSPFTQFYELAERRGWRSYTLPCGHDVMLAKPEELARILLDAAGSVGTESAGA